MSALTSLLVYAAASVPRYSGLPPDLGRFPLMDKHLVWDDLDACLSQELGMEKKGLRDFLLLERLPGDCKHDHAYGQNIWVEETSGSSGIPFRVAKTAEERMRVAFGIWRYRRKYDPQVTMGNFYPFAHAPANLPSMGNLRDQRPAALDKLYQNLSAAGIRWVHGLARTLRQHAEGLSAEAASTKTVCFAESSGHTLTEEDRHIIESKLKVTLIDQYGCREVWAIGVRHDNGCFDVLSDNVVAELVDNAGHPITTPGVEGRVIVTSLHQRIFPIIRYDTRDLGFWDDEPIGRRLRLSDCREHNILQLRGRAVNGNEFFKSVLNSAHLTIGQTRLDYIQIRQKAPGVFMVVVNKTPKAAKLCEMVSRLCQAHADFPQPASFELEELTEQEVESLAHEKPALFTTKQTPESAVKNGRVS